MLHVLDTSLLGVDSSTETSNSQEAVSSRCIVHHMHVIQAASSKISEGDYAMGEELIVCMHVVKEWRAGTLRAAP